MICLNFDLFLWNAVIVFAGGRRGDDSCVTLLEKRKRQRQRYLSASVGRKLEVMPVGKTQKERERESERAREPDAPDFLFLEG